MNAAKMKEEAYQKANELCMEVLNVRKTYSKIKLKFCQSGDFTLTIKKVGESHWMFMHKGNCIASNLVLALIRLKARMKCS